MGNTSQRTLWRSPCRTKWAVRNDLTFSLAFLLWKENVSFQCLKDVKLKPMEFSAGCFAVAGCCVFQTLRIEPLSLMARSFVHTIFWQKTCVLLCQSSFTWMNSWQKADCFKCGKAWSWISRLWYCPVFPVMDCEVVHVEIAVQWRSLCKFWQDVTKPAILNMDVGVLTTDNAMCANHFQSIPSGRLRVLSYDSMSDSPPWDEVSVCIFMRTVTRWLFFVNAWVRNHYLSLVIAANSTAEILWDFWFIFRAPKWGILGGGKTLVAVHKEKDLLECHFAFVLSVVFN